MPGPHHGHHGHHHHGGGRRGGFIGVPWDLTYTTVNPWFQTIGIDGKCYLCNSFTGECIPCSPIQRVGIYEGELIPTLHGWPDENNRVQYVGQDNQQVIYVRSDIIKEKQFLNNYVYSTDKGVNASLSTIPENLKNFWINWRDSYLKFGQSDPYYINPFGISNDMEQMKKFEDEFASIQNQLAQYANVSPMYRPTDAPSAQAPSGGILSGPSAVLDKGTDIVKYGLIAGGIIILGLAIVASQNIKSGGQVVSKVL